MAAASQPVEVNICSYAQKDSQQFYCHADVAGIKRLFVFPIQAGCGSLSRNNERLNDFCIQRILQGAKSISELKLKSEVKAEPLAPSTVATKVDNLPYAGTLKSGIPFYILSISPGTKSGEIQCEYKIHIHHNMSYSFSVPVGVVNLVDCAAKAISDLYS